MNNQPLFAFPRLRDFIHRAFVKLGMPNHDAATVAHLMASADLQGSDGHGIIRLPPYSRRILNKGMNLTPNIRAIEERAATALLDGDNGMGHLVMSKAAEIAAAKAKNCGIAWVGSRYSNHAGPASLYARMALEHNMIGLYFAVGNANHLPPWGGLDMLLSTNPIAVAGKVKAKAQRNEMMPEGWMIDRQGKPLLDPKKADEGFLLPIGGYKGYGLSLIVGLLAGTLNGAAMGKAVIDFNHDEKSTTNTGQAIAMIDPAAFGDIDQFKQRVDTLVGEIRGSEKMPGVDRIWLPGEQSEAKRAKYTEQGIPLPEKLVQTLADLATQLNIEPL
jgi:L-2-hydroxycarboxylate dehydrogenase (NAD+)